MFNKLFKISFHDKIVSKKNNKGNLFPTYLPVFVSAVIIRIRIYLFFGQNIVFPMFCFPKV